MALFQQHKYIILEKFMQLNVTASDNKNVSTFLLEPFVYRTILLMLRLTILLFSAWEMFSFTLCNNPSVDLAPKEDLALSVYLEKITSVPVKINLRKGN